jgi:hypothetical protein
MNPNSLALIFAPGEMTCMRGNFKNFIKGRTADEEYYVKIYSAEIFRNRKERAEKLQNRC